MGWGGGEVPSDAGPYIGISGDFDPPNYLNDKVHSSFHLVTYFAGGYLGQLTEDGACHRECGQAGGIISRVEEWGYRLIWMFPKMVGFPPKSSMFNGVFHYFTIHFGVSLFLKHPYRWTKSCVDISCQGWMKIASKVVGVCLARKDLNSRSNDLSKVFHV